MGNTATRADQGRDCGAAEIQRIAKNAPRWPDMNLAALAERSFSISEIPYFISGDAGPTGMSGFHR
jgi:hypothetical protein